MNKFTQRLALVGTTLALAISGLVYAAVSVPARHFKLPASMTARPSGKQKPANPRGFKAMSDNSASKPKVLYSDGGVTLYGDVIYSDNWEEESAYGVYSIDASTGKLTAESSTGDYNFFARGGAVYKDGHFYTITGNEYSATWYDYNTDGWDEENENEVDPTWLAADMTVNPADNKIYAAMADGNGGMELTTVNFTGSSNDRQVIGTLENNLVAIAADAYGQLYGIGTDGILYKVSSTDAEETKVGTTNISPSGLQSATFDYATGNLYWAASTASGVGALYTVNTTTGAATRVAYFSGNEQIVGLYSLSEATSWDGPDVPAAPTNVTATDKDGKTSITWTAPSKGLHNGAEFDSAATRYDIVRLPDSVTVATDVAATTFTYDFTPVELGAYTYEVTAKNDAGTGGSAKSNIIVSGNAVTPPYAQDFTDESSFALLTMVDGDGDGSTWQASATSHSAFEAGAPFESTNDWLFTPRLALKSDRLYRLRFAIGSSLAANYPFTVKAAVGNAPTEDAATQTIQESTRISQPDTFNLGGYFKIDTDGNYYVGVNVSGYDIQFISLYNLYVDEGPKLAAPDSVTSLVATAAKDGSSHVDFAFVAPSKTVDGNAISSLSAIKVYRGTTLVATIDNVTPGGSYTAEDNAPAANAFNDYRIVAENGEGEGLAAETTVYVGIDVPLPPTNVVAAYDPTDAGKVVLSWTAPVTGVNGGYIDPDNITYGIQRMVGQSQAEVVAVGHKDTTITDAIDTTGEQAYQIYGVAAQNSRDYSSIAASNALIKGAPYTLPFMETFPNGERKYFWIASTSPADGYASWGISDNSFSYNGSYKAGDEATIASGKINPSGAVNPILEYDYWFRAEDGDDSLEVYLIKNGTDTILIDDEPYTLYMNSKDYEKVTVPLAKYIDSDTKFIQVAYRLRTYSSDAMPRASVANIVVRDQQDYDLMASAISAPSTAVAGDTIDVTAVVRNYGLKTADSYEVELLESDKTIGVQQATSLQGDSVKAFTFRVPVNTLKDTLAFSFYVNYGADQVTSNDNSDTATTVVTLPVYPAPTEGTGKQNGRSQVDLTWKAPDYESFTVPAVDGADDYAAFAIDSIGQWTVRDLDGKATHSDIQVDWNDISYTHKGEPMAWIVMNPTVAGAPLTNWMDEPTGWQPVSGTQYFASISSSDGNVDDWLISPELTGDAQTISFYQHGYYGIEKYEVLYSTTDTATASFTSLGTQQSASSWTKVSFELPAGAKYFAIRNLGGDYSQYFFVDDIEYLPLSNKGVLKLSGYNVYRDGDKLATVDADATSYSDLDAADGIHNYQVTAVYNLGESKATAIELNVSGITVLRDGNSKINVSGSRLTFNGNADVYTVDGRRVFSGNASNGVALPSGAYVIRAGGETMKTVIK